MLRLAELVGREVGDLRADLGLGRVARGVLELALVDGVELLPGALLLVDAGQRGDGAVVRLVEVVEDPAVRADRVRDVVQARLVELAEARVEVDEIERVGGRLDAHLEDLRELGPRLDREVDAIEVREGLGVLAVDAEDVLVRLLGLGDVPELVLERAREAPADGLLDLGVGVRSPRTSAYALASVSQPPSTLAARRGASSPDFSSSGNSLRARM